MSYSSPSLQSWYLFHKEEQQLWQLQEICATYRTLNMHSQTLCLPYPALTTHLFREHSLPPPPVWSKKSNPTAEVSEAKGFQSASRESHTSGNLTLTSSPRSFHSSRQLRTVSEQHYCLQQEDKRKQRYRLWMAASVNLFISFPFLLQETMSG